MAKQTGLKDGRKRTRGNGKAKATATSTTVPEELQQTIRGACGEVIKFQAAGMNIRDQYLQREASILVQLRTATKKRDALIKKACEDLGIPNDWILAVETMAFRPPGAPPEAFGRRTPKDTTGTPGSS